MNSQQIDRAVEHLKFSRTSRARARLTSGAPAKTREDTIGIAGGDGIGPII